MSHPTRRSVLARPLVAAAAIALDRAVPAQEPEGRPGIRNRRLEQAAVHWCYGGPLEELAALLRRASS